MHLFKLATVLITTAFLMTGCSTFNKLFVKNVYIVPELPSSVFTTCNKPKSVREDLGVVALADVKGMDLEVVNDMYLEAYAKEKYEHISCYKTMDNVQQTYSAMKDEVEKLNPPKKKK